MLIEYHGVKSINGIGTVSYRVDFYSKVIITTSTLIEETIESNIYSYIESNLTAGEYYEVEIVAINNQCEGCPL